MIRPRRARRGRSVRNSESNRFGAGPLAYPGGRPTAERSSPRASHKAAAPHRTWGAHTRRAGAPPEDNSLISPQTGCGNRGEATRTGTRHWDRGACAAKKIFGDTCGNSER